MGCRAPKASPKASNNPVLINGIKGGNLRAKIAPVWRGQKSRNAPVQFALLKLNYSLREAIGNPKAETRRPKEGRSPRAEYRNHGLHG